MTMCGPNDELAVYLWQLLTYLVIQIYQGQTLDNKPEFNFMCKESLYIFDFHQ